MFKSKSYQKRNVNASLGSEKKHRIFSSKPQNNKNTRIHTESYDAGYQITKPIKTRLQTSAMEQVMKSTGWTAKQPQKLFQENYQLKVQLNDLNTQLCLTRSKMESQKKKNVLYIKKLNREFEKELYWPSDKGTDYLITGIKHQYEKLKESYEKVSKQLQQTKQTLVFCDTQELKAYCESLQVQNKILIQNITYLKSHKKRPSKLSEESDLNNQFQRADVQYRINEQKRKKENYKKKVNALENQVMRQAVHQKELLKKIEFLEKLIIEKENNAYHASKRVKLVQKQKAKLVNQVKNFDSKMQQKKSEHLRQFNQFKEKTQRQAKIQKLMFQKLLKQKGNAIEKLQKEIAYLSTLLSYWKPLDELDKIDIKEQSSSHKEKTISLNLNQSMSMHGSNHRQISRSKTPVNMMFFEENQSGDQRCLIRNSQNQELLFGKDSVMLTINRDNSDSISKLENYQSREPRRSTKRWSDEAQKNRKVELQQIEHLGELIKYKMIAVRKSLPEIKQFFGWPSGKVASNKFEEEFITMKQVSQIMAKQPFQLANQDAYLLSRYIIEDSGVQYVYSHQENELERSIVKSIIKAVVGEYALPDFDRAEGKWRQIKKIYSQNMQMALKSICPKGTVSKNKFLQLMNSLGIQSDEETKNYIISKLVQHQNSLIALHYDILFEPQQILQ